MDITTRDFNRLRISEFTQNFWVFSFYIADFWQTFWVIWEHGSNWSNLMLNMTISAPERLKNDKILHLQPNFTICLSLNGLQSKISALITRWDPDITQTNLSWLRLCINYAQSVLLRLRCFSTQFDSDFTQIISGSGFTPEKAPKMQQMQFRDKTAYA